MGSQHPFAFGDPDSGDPYPRRLFALLTLATFFEGFDTKLVSLVLPLLGREFGSGPRELGLALSLTGVGMLLAFAVIRGADRVGRRRVFLAALAGFAALTLASALAPNLAVFTAFQFGARMLLVTELALAYVMLSEELPAHSRGRANAWLGAFASVGASLPAFFLAPLEAWGVGWRGLFAIGALPLLLWPVYLRVLREPPLFVREERTARGWRAEVAAWRPLFDTALRPRLLGTAALWWVLNFWTATSLFFFTLYAFEERGWNAGHLQWLPLGTIPIGFAGYALAGQIMDRIGRRAAATLYLLSGAASAVFCFQATGDAAIYAGYFGLIASGGLWSIAATLTTELFPTALRATAMGVTNNLVGRSGLILGPLVAGALSETLGSVGDAASWLAGVNLLCLPVLWRCLPETRGVELDAPQAS